MRILCIGGGPSALYFSILRKRAAPADEILVLERNRPDDTFGWGVVFSAETLGNLREADARSMAEIERSFAWWDDIEIHFGGECVRSTGHGFCGLSRKRLLNILQARAAELGVELRYGVEVGDPAAFGAFDLVLGADGINSQVRERGAAHFRPRLDWRKCRFSWLGTTRPLGAFTFHFVRSEWGLFQVHAYPFEMPAPGKPGLSTWIVECAEEVWRAAGLEQASEDETVRFCERLFARELDGHRLLANRSLWRAFPTIACERWVHGNTVLVGDAAHTAHFSIGSGTKLAMEDSIALAGVLAREPRLPLPEALALYERERMPEVIRVQRAAQTSLEWFENSARYLGQDPLPFAFNLLSRSKRITWDNLEKRDAALVERVREDFGQRHAAPRASGGRRAPPMFAPFELRGLRLANRVVVSPMCQYSAVDGTPNDWHLVHLGSRALGGAALVITEMTDVSADGRITLGCTGMYAEEHAAAWRRVTEFVHRHTPAVIGMQLAHAGRKGSALHPWEGPDVPLPGGPEGNGAWRTLGPSALPFAPGWPAPKEMDRADMERVREDFARAARLAERAGFDLLELHMAHGYLLSSFLSPLANRRADAYGGSLENRMRFPLEVFAAVRAAWPAEKPISVRVTASDWVESGGFTPDDAVVLARALKELGCDLIDVSSGGNSLESKPVYGRMYQVPFAEQIRYEAEMPVMAVGGIQGADHANTILAAGRADLVCLARPHLADPYLVLHAAARYGYDLQPWPGQYLLGKPRGQPPAV